MQLLGKSSESAACSVPPSWRGFLPSYPAAIGSIFPSGGPRGGGSTKFYIRQSTAGKLDEPRS